MERTSIAPSRPAGQEVADMMDSLSQELQAGVRKDWEKLRKQFIYHDLPGFA